MQSNTVPFTDFVRVPLNSDDIITYYVIVPKKPVQTAEWAL